MSTPNSYPPVPTPSEQTPAPAPVYGQPTPAAYGQPTYGQPAYGQPAAPVYTQPAYAVPAYQPVPSDPGQLLGILSLVAIFILPVAGIFLGFFGRKQSRAAGYPGTLSTVGMWINIGCTALAVLIIAIAVIFWIIALASIGAAAGTYGTGSY